jgi:CDP-diacylglycerol---serine O-phosphatidyltransferase
MKRRRTGARVRLRLRRGAYLLPSLFTTGNMLLGFYSVVSGLKGNFPRAALAIFAAAFLDALDGRLARLMGTDSEFGKEYDSLADLFTFGAAPALLCYVWGLRDFGRAGWLIPLFYMVCAATRLARCNVKSKVVDSRYFVGLPAPAAAGSVGSILLFARDPEWKTWIGALLAGALLALGVLMVSTFRYWSFKRIDLKRRRSYRFLLLPAAVLLVVAYHPPAFFLVVAVIYTLSGPVSWLTARLRHRNPDGREGEAAAETEREPSEA